MHYQNVIDFWFQELRPKDWFDKNPELDETIRRRFSSVLQQALCGELYAWRENEYGRLAEIIVLDQFTRNIHRGSPLAFAGDPMALVLSQEAVYWKVDTKLDIQERAFLYMPHMHSESLKVHQEAVRLFEQPGLEDNLRFEILHKQILERFGRFPHRNQILGRTSTPEEIDFLKQPGSSF